MIRCPSCGEEVSAHATICRFCEAELTTDATGEGPYCTQCGVATTPDAKFCAACGAAIAATNA
jgi:primosomal protein N'